MQRVRMLTRRTFVGSCLALAATASAREREAPPLMLANVYREEAAYDLRDFWVSEKLDGVRAYWNGSQLLTRSGNAIAAPVWFVANLPPASLDGELWGGRGTFERASAVVRTKAPADGAWRELRYMTFDMPAPQVTFDARRERLAEAIARVRSPWISTVEQQRVRDVAGLTARLEEVEALGGEGLMLHRSTSIYTAGRSDDLLKLKSFEDDEAQVIGYEPGKGRYEGMVGALVVRGGNGMQFKIGSGLNDAERRSPPPLGAWVTYAHNGLTSSGLPRFPRYLRLHGDRGGEGCCRSF